MASFGAPRDHHALFIQTNPSRRSGYRFQVTGNIQQGMIFGHRIDENPEEAPDFVSKEYLGVVTEADYQRVQSTVERIDPPKKQFEGGHRLYPKEPLRRCQEWTRDAIELLKREGILNTQDPDLGNI